MDPGVTGLDRRLAPFIRMWRIVLLLRSAPRSLSELAAMLGVHERTIRRDLCALQRVPLPITCRYPIDEGNTRRGIRTADPNLWYFGETPVWPRRELAPLADPTAMETR